MKSIQFAQVQKAWQDTAAVDDISFDVPKGSFTVLLGPSGCGKSTTLRLLAGLETCSAGRIFIDDEDVTDRSPAHRNLAMVFQSYALFPHLSVAENILFGQKIRKISKAKQTEQIQKIADLLSLQGLLDRKPSQLSGGQQQRVALGRAIISEKPICLMDEPLSNLDAKLRHEMRLEIRALQQKLGITMVYVTHDQVEAISMADQIILLNKGKIEQVGTPVEIYHKPASIFVARFIGTPPSNILNLDMSGGVVKVAGSQDPLFTSKEIDVSPLYLGLRPEDITIGNAGLAAKVIGFEFLGADVLLECQVGTERLIVRTSNQNTFTQNQTVFLRWKASAMHFFNAKTERRVQLSPGDKRLGSWNDTSLNS